MPKLLSADAIAQFAEEGYYYPLRILDEEQAASYRAQLENFEKTQGKPVGGAQRSKSHLLFKWVDELMRHDTPGKDLVEINHHPVPEYIQMGMIDNVLQNHEPLFTNRRRRPIEIRLVKVSEFPLSGCQTLGTIWTQIDADGK